MERTYFMKGNEDYINQKSIPQFNNIIDSLEFRKYNDENTLFSSVVNEMKFENKPKHYAFTLQYGCFCLYSFEFIDKSVIYILDTPDLGLIKIAEDN